MREPALPSEVPLASPRLEISESSPKAQVNKSSLQAQPVPSSPVAAQGKVDEVAQPASGSPDLRATETPSSGSTLDGRAQRDGPLSTATTALERPNGAWAIAPAAPKTEAGQTLLEPPGITGEGTPERKPNETEASRPPAVAEKDRQVWEMSQRAKSASISSPPPPGLLSQALAYIMAQVS